MNRIGDVEIPDSRESRIQRTRVTMTFALSLLLLTLIRLGDAQLITTATINGTVTDRSGDVVPQATVSITDTGTGRVVTSVSNTDGRFSQVGLGVGTYQLSVTKAGFATYRESGIYLGPASVRTVTVVLTPGAVSSSVTVSASALQVQTSSSAVSSQVTRQQVETFPLNGRSYQGLAALMPGVTNLSAGTALGTGGFTTYNTMSINGMGKSGTLYTVDGIWNMNSGWFQQTTITPNPDQIEQVQVLQNNYDAKYNLIGANVVILQTKSGTAAFHGGAWEYLRNNDLNARNYFATTVPTLKWNIYGWNLGGPVYIPNHFNADRRKMFFYVNEQWVRQDTAKVLTGSTPTAAMREGIFPTTGPFGATIRNPATGQPFPNNTIPANMINQNALTFLNAFASLPNNPGAGFLNYISETPVLLTQRDDEGKIDYNITQRLRLTGEYLDERQTSPTPGTFPTQGQTLHTPNQLAQVQLTQIISPSMVNQTSVSMNYYIIDSSYTGLFENSQLPNFSEKLPYNGFLSNYLPQATFSGGWTTIGANAGTPFIRASDLEDTISDDWSWQRGKHQLEAGGAWVFGTKRQYSGVNPISNGQYSFTGQFTGSPIADFLLGDSATFGQSNNQFRKYIHYPIGTPYFEDHWKATRRLTLSAGLRFLYEPWSHQQVGYEIAFDPATFNPAQAPTVTPNGTIIATPNYNPENGLIFNGQNGVPLNLSDAHKYYFAPVVGFALDLFGDGRTSLRGGYSINYTKSATSSDCAQACIGYPLIQSVNLINAQFSNPSGGQAAPLTTTSLTTEDLKNIQAAQIQTFSLSLERQLGNDWFLSIAGVGDIGRRIGVQANINQPLPAGGYDFNPLINTGTVSSSYYAPYQGWSSITMDTSEGVAYWDAFELGLRHPVGHNLFLTVAYTWSHNLSNVPSGQYGIQGGGLQNPYALSQAYGNSPLNVPQIFNASLIYNLPWLEKTTGWRRGLLAGWQYSTIATLQTGSSLTPGLSISNPGLATHPNVVAPLTRPKTVHQWFNTAAYAAPAYGHYGNSGYGTVLGPGVIDFDIAFYKTFALTERVKLQFRGELFNAFNHTNFSAVSTSLGSGSFGQVTSAADPRIGEFALRLNF